MHFGTFCPKVPTRGGATTATTYIRPYKQATYVYAKPNKCDPNKAAKYIGRYLGRPVIATSRIDNYDGKSVTGIYARHRESDKKLNLAVPKEKRRLILSFNRWRNCIAASFGYDPLKCPHCGETMALMELCIKHKRVPLEEMYEKVMSKARRCRSPMPT